MSNKILTRQEAYNIGGGGSLTEPNRCCTIQMADSYGLTDILPTDTNKNRLIYSAKKKEEEPSPTPTKVYGARFFLSTYGMPSNKFEGGEIEVTYLDGTNGVIYLPSYQGYTGTLPWGSHPSGTGFMSTEITASYYNQYKYPISVNNFSAYMSTGGYLLNRYMGFFKSTEGDPNDGSNASTYIQNCYVANYPYEIYGTPKSWVNLCIVVSTPENKFWE